MTSVEVNETALLAAVQAFIQERARLTFEIYNATPHEKDSADYPFEDRHASGGSVKDASSQHVVPIPGGASIQIEAAGAIASEFGNDPGRSGTTDSAGGKVIRPRTKKELAIALTQAGSRLAKDPSSGRLYFVTESVKSYAGKHYLEHAVRKAFGLAPR